MSKLYWSRDAFSGNVKDVQRKIKESKDSLQNKFLKVLRVTLRIENALMSKTNI